VPSIGHCPNGVTLFSRGRLFVRPPKDSRFRHPVRGFFSRVLTESCPLRISQQLYSENTHRSARKCARMHGVHSRVTAPQSQFFCFDSIQPPRFVEAESPTRRERQGFSFVDRRTKTVFSDLGARVERWVKRESGEERSPALGNFCLGSRDIVITLPQSRDCPVDVELRLWQSAAA